MGLLHDRVHLIGRVKTFERRVVRDFVLRDSGIVGGVLLQECLVSAQKRRGLRVAIMPDQHHPSAGLHDAAEFAASGVGLKPVERLPSDDEIGAAIGKGSRLRRAVDHGEFLEASQILFPGSSHIAIGLDPNYAIAVFQEDLGQHSGTTANINNEMLGIKIAGFAESRHDLGRVARTIFDVVIDAVGGALGGSRLRGGHGCILAASGSAVSAPTPGWVIKRWAGGHFSTSGSMAWLSSAMAGLRRSSNSSRSRRRGSPTLPTSVGPAGELQANHYSASAPIASLVMVSSPLSC